MPSVEYVTDAANCCVPPSRIVAAGGSTVTVFAARTFSVAVPGSTVGASGCAALIVAVPPPTPVAVALSTPLTTSAMP